MSAREKRARTRAARRDPPPPTGPPDSKKQLKSDVCLEQLHQLEQLTAEQLAAHVCTLIDSAWRLDLRMEALSLLERIDDAAFAPHAHRLFELFGSSASEMRDFAEDKLMAQGESTLAVYAARLIELYDSDDGGVCMRASRILGELAPSTLAEHAAALARAAQPRKPPSPDGERYALEMMARLPPTTLADYTDAIGKQLASKDEFVSRAAAVTLCGISPARILAAAGGRHAAALRNHLGRQGMSWQASVEDICGVHGEQGARVLAAIGIDKATIRQALEEAVRLRELTVSMRAS